MCLDSVCQEISRSFYTIALIFLTRDLITRLGPLQARVPYRPGVPTDKGLIHTLCNFCRQCAPTRYTGNTARGNYKQGTLTNTVQFLQTRGPYMIYRQGRKAGVHKGGLEGYIYPPTFEGGGNISIISP